MVSESGTLESLEAKAPILFILGGVLYGIGTVGLIITTYTGTSFGMDTTFAALGKVLVPLGLLGLYPALVERRPYLSRAAAVVAVIPAACWSLAFVGGGILEPAGILDGAPGPLALAPFVGFIGLYVRSRSSASLPSSQTFIPEPSPFCCWCTRRCSHCG
jgi:hypothetical protein